MHEAQEVSIVRSGPEGPARVNRGPLAQLAPLFFRRFFENDLLSPQEDVGTTVGCILALLATPGLLIPLLGLVKYGVVGRHSPRVFTMMLLTDKCFYITLSMIVMGAIAVLEWDTLFPDRRDYLVLVPLPVKIRAILGAKFLALLIFLAIFCFDVNIFSSALYPAVALEAKRFVPDLPDYWRFCLAHLAAAAAGGAFIFLAFLALQGALLNVFGYRLFRRLSTLLQFLSLAWLLALFLFHPAAVAMLDNFRRGEANLLWFFPPAWFLGLYETLCGRGEPEFRLLASTALRALAAAAALALLAYGAGFGRRVRRTLESAEHSSSGPRWVEALLTRLTDGVFIRGAAERASFYFVRKTLARSRQHRLYMAAYAGVAFALVLESLIVMLSPVDYGRVSARDATLYTIPHILSFFLLCGMRFAFTVPSELRANWIFRLAAGEGRGYIRGAWKSMTLLAVFPLLAALFPLYVYLWGWRAALLHGVYSFALCLLLIEILLVTFRKIPFTCAYQPGRARITTRWILYWVAFATYAYSLGSLEPLILARPVRFIAFLGFVFAAAGGLAFLRRRLEAAHPLPEFAPEPEPFIQTVLAMR